MSQPKNYTPFLFLRVLCSKHAFETSFFSHSGLNLNRRQIPSLLHPSHACSWEAVSCSRCLGNTYALPLFPWLCAGGQYGLWASRTRWGGAEPSSGWALVISAGGCSWHMFTTFPAGQTACSNTDHSICKHCASKTIKNCKTERLGEDHTIIS